jgi:UDP-sugar pyrophosphorylase
LLPRPSAPAKDLGKTIDFASPDFETLEKIGRAEVSKLGVVLVAGGLGERLGYSGIKVGRYFSSITSV